MKARTILLAAALCAFAQPLLAQVILAQQQREDAQKRYQAGSELMTREKFEEAVVEFQAAIKLDPGFFLARYSLGQAFMALKRYPDAVTAYEGARDVILSQASLDQKAMADVDRRRRDEIRELEEHLQALQAGKIKGVEGVGQQVGLEDRIRMLKDQDLRGAEGTPRVPAELSVALGSAHFRQGHLEEAEKEYRAAIARDPKHGAAHNNIAVICMLTGRLEEAQEEVKKAEKAGFAVSAAFKKDLEQRIKAKK